MKEINLRDYYPFYTSDCFIEVTDDVAEMFKEFDRKEAAYDDELRSVVEEWYKHGDLRLENSLFSKPEQNYLNYELNKSTYSNGHDLRNKYAHSTYPEDEKMQFVDYIKLLKIMILVVTKINEEFCLREEINEMMEES